jgi:REP element-mobilizing transposase RayT
MYYRRKLPHYHPDITEGDFLFVTWRLAGSVPPPRRLPPAVAMPLSAGRAFLASDCEADKAAFGPVWLQDARVAGMVADALRHGETGRNFYVLPAWVIMPNHVHIVLQPKVPMPVIMRWLKGSTARQANLILGRTGSAFWQDESFDHRVRDEAELDRIVGYVERNPVNAGLVDNPGDWLWSSARLAGERLAGERLAGESACPTIQELPQISAVVANLAPAPHISASALSESSALSVSTASVTTVTGLPVFNRPRTA